MIQGLIIERSSSVSFHFFWQLGQWHKDWSLNVVVRSVFNFGFLAAWAMIQGLIIERSSSVSNLGLLKLTIIFASHLWYLIFFSILLLSVPCTRCRATIHWTKSHYNLCGAEQRATGRLQPLWCVHGAKEGSTGRKATTTSATSVVPSNDPLQQHHCPFFSPSMLRGGFCGEERPRRYWTPTQYKQQRANMQRFNCCKSCDLSNKFSSASSIREAYGNLFLVLPTLLVFYAFFL